MTSQKVTPALIKGFVGSVLASRYDDAVATPDFHLEFWDMACSKHRLVSIAAPRYHAKSTAITHAYLLAKLLFRESDYALIVSDTEGQAKKFLQDVMIDVTTNEELVALFEIDGLEKETETELVVRFKDGVKFKVEVRGAGQKVRGAKWEQKRPNLIIVDDLENDEHVASKEQRDKLKRWVNGALIPSMSRRGILRCVGTILHADSWLSSTMPDESSPLTKITPLKTWNPLPTNGWFSAKYRGHPGIGDYSQLLWPEYKTKQWFIDEYNRHVADGQEDVYSAEQLNAPIDATNAFFKKPDFRDFPRKPNGEVNLPELNYYAAGDFAISKAQRADFTVEGVAGVDSAGNVYLVDLIRGRFDPDESVAHIFDIEKKYNPGFFLVEKGVLAHAIGGVLNKEMGVRGMYPNLLPVTTTGDKRTKARGIQKIARSGHFYVDKKAEWYPAFEDECLRFDRGRNDDQVDVIALFGLKIDEMLNARTQEEAEEDEWEEEYRETMPTGANETTGY